MAREIDKVRKVDKHKISSFRKLFYINGCIHNFKKRSSILCPKIIYILNIYFYDMSTHRH